MVLCSFLGRGGGGLSGYGYGQAGPSYPAAYQSPALYGPYDPNMYPANYQSYGTAAATYGATANTGYEFSSPSGFGAVRYPGKFDMA